MASTPSMSTPMGGPVILPGVKNSGIGEAHVHAAGRDFQMVQTNNISHFHFRLFRRSKKEKGKEEDDLDSLLRPEDLSDAWFEQSPDGRWTVRAMDNTFHEISVGNAQARARGRAYVRNMISYGLGLPCWDPRRYSPFIPENGITPGDVGTFDAGEGFSKLFNIWEDYKAIQSFVFGPELPERDIVSRSNELNKGSTIVYGASANVVHTPSSILERFTFTCFSTEGATLAVTSPVDSELLSKKAKSDLHTLIIQNAAALYGHAFQLTHIHPHESLYIVTGCFKTESWAMAGYFHPMDDSMNTLTLKNTTPDTGTDNFVWINRGNAQTATSEGGCRPGIKDQSLFLQGFKLTLDRSVPQNVKDTFSTGGDRSNRSGPPGSDGGPSQGRDGSDRNTSNRGGKWGGRFWSGGSGSSSRSGGPGDGDGRLADMVEQLKTSHPSDFINQALLAESKAPFALSHDDDWRFVLKGHRWDETGFSQLVDAVYNRPIAVDNGVAFLSYGIQQVDNMCGQCANIQTASEDTAAENFYISWLQKNVNKIPEAIRKVLAPSVFGGYDPFVGLRLGVLSEVVVTKVPPLWALIIGIDHYQHPGIVNLRGAASDADEMSRFLRSALNIPRKQILDLRNNQATRIAILTGFEDLRDNTNIKRGDPILIYYAGHGGEVPTKGADKTQALLPVDYDPRETPPIPARTVAALIEGITHSHGDNITVIFDCGYYGDKIRGRTDGGIKIRGVELTPDDVPDSLDAHITMDPKNHSGSGTGFIHYGNGFSHTSAGSHVLLTACSDGELAREEINGQRASGRFTAALLDLFRRVPPNQITYCNILAMIPRINGQNPQVEGQKRDRILFDSKVHPPTLRSYGFDWVHAKEGALRLLSGRVDGITNGAEFTLFKSKEGIPDRPLCVLVAREFNIRPFETILEFVDYPPPRLDPLLRSQPGVLAIQTRAGASADLNLHIPLVNQYFPVFAAVGTETRNPKQPRYCIKLVDRDEADLEVIAVGEHKFIFNALDKWARQYGFTRPHALTVDVDVDTLDQVLQLAAHYHHHLNLYHENTGIENRIKFDLFHLTKKDEEPGLLELQPEPSEFDFQPDGESLYDERRGVIDLEVDPYGVYGMRIVNDTSFDLYFSCLYFSHDTLDISAICEGTLRNHAVETIGYGATGTAAWCFETEGLNLGFLNFYFSSEPIDLSHIPQQSPFQLTRGFNILKRRSLAKVLGTILIPVIMRTAAEPY